MALSHTLTQEHNKFGLDIPNVYAKIIDVVIKDEPILHAPEAEGGDPVTVSKHTVKFTVHTFVSKEKSQMKEGPVAAHTYTIPLDYNTNTNIIAACYAWLKANVPMLYSDAADI